MPVTITFPTPSGVHEEIWGYTHEDDYCTVELVCLGGLMRMSSLLTQHSRLIFPTMRERGFMNVLPPH